MAWTNTTKVFALLVVSLQLLIFIQLYRMHHSPPHPPSLPAVVMLHSASSSSSSPPLTSPSQPLLSLVTETTPKCEPIACPAVLPCPKPMIAVPVPMPAPKPKTNLVLAFCDLPAKELYRFVASFRRSGSSATLMCFHVKPVVDAAIKYVYEAFGPVLLQRFEVPLGVSAVNYRFVAFEQYLKAHNNEYDRILLVDARDLFFQTDPFLWVTQGLIVTQETITAGHTLGGNSVNTKWIVECFGVYLFALSLSL